MTGKGMFGAVLAGALAVASSQTYATPYYELGAGNLTCGRWVADESTEVVHNADLEWVLGFLSGIGYSLSGVANNNPLLGLDADAVGIWIGNYCQAHPLQAIDKAAVALDEEHPHG